MQLRRLTSLLSVVLLAFSTAPGSEAQCSQPRVRRSWTALSSADRQLYKDAIAASMDSGAYIKFVEIHTEMMSEMEAHRQCMFIYWHRLFLTAFENMLRGQAARFSCVTVPYWDWMTDYSKFIGGQCSSLLGCSPALSFLGDAVPVSRGIRAVTINGESIRGYCEADAPMNHFCQSSQVTGTRCAQCLPRDDWSRTSFPASASFASVRAQLFGAANIGEMSASIEQGVHNNIHAELGSTMATFQSPADPVFWSHHAMVDLLHSVFHKCKVGEQKLTFAQKTASVDWTSCERRNGGIFNPTDDITMRTGYMGRRSVLATKDTKVGKYFSTVPQQFAALIDIRDLGASSYSYELQGLVSSLYTLCGATAPVARHLADDADVTVFATQAPSAADVGTEAPTLAPAANATVPPFMGALISKTTEPATIKFAGWMNNTDKLVKRRGGNAVREAEKMACLFQDECLGGVTAYTPEFKKRFGTTKEPRCKQIVDRIRRKADSVKVTEWKAQMVETFGCPKPKNSPTQSTTTAPVSSVTPRPSSTATETPAPTDAATATAGSSDSGNYVAMVGQKA